MLHVTLKILNSCKNLWIATVLLLTISCMHECSISVYGSCKSNLATKTKENLIKSRDLLLAINYQGSLTNSKSIYSRILCTIRPVDMA